MNKNAELIRNMINIYESVEKKIISNTIVKTNNYILNEDFISKVVRDEIGAATQANRSTVLSKLSAEFKGFFDGMLKNAELSAKLEQAGIRTSDELVTAIASNFKNVPTELSGSLKGGLELTILKSNTTNAKLIEAASENLINNKTFLSKYADDINKGQPAFEAALTNSRNYSKNAITKIVERVNTKYGMKVDKSKLPKPKDPKPKDPKPTDPKPTDPKPTDPTWWEKIKQIGWTKAILAAAGVGIVSYLLWFWFKQNNIKDEDFPPVPPIDPDNEWAPCLVKILENKQGRVDKLTSGTLVVKVKNTTYPDGVLFFADGKVLTNNGKRKGTWKCKGGKVTDIKEQSTTTNNIGSDVEKIVSYLKGNVINSSMLTNVKNILNTYNKSGQGKQLLSAYKRISGEFLENTLQSKTTLNDPSERKIRNEIYTIIRAVKGSGGTSTSDPLSGIEIIWDDKKKEEVTPIKKDLYRDCNDFPLTFGCKGPLVSELQICLKMTGVDGKLGPNTKATAESWGSKNNIPFLIPLGDKEVFGVTEENFKKICLNKPNPEPVVITPPNVDGPIDNPTITPEEPTKPEERKKSDEELGWGLYTKLKKAGLLYPRKGLLGGERIIYKGSDLSDENQRLLITYLNMKDYVLTTDNGEIKQGEKLVFKKIKRK